MSEFDTLEVLMKTVKKRMKDSPKNSYTAKLVNKGREQICKKLGEEAVELALSGVQDNKKDSIAESADLLYHMCVLWVDMGISPKKLMEELRRREGISGIDEKKNRDKK